MRLAPIQVASMFQRVLALLGLCATISLAVRPESLLEQEKGQVTLQLHSTGHARVALDSTGHGLKEAQVIDKGEQLLETSSTSVERKEDHHAKVQQTSRVSTCGPVSRMTKAAGMSLLQFFGRAESASPDEVVALEDEKLNKEAKIIDGVDYVTVKSCEGVSDVFRHLVSQERQAEVFLMIGSVFATILALICLSVIVGASMKHSPPSYWKNRATCCCTFNDSYMEEVDVTKEYLPVVQKLFDMTTCPSKMGVGRDGSWQTHKAFKVTKVVRIENGKQWSAFAAARRATHTFFDKIQGMEDDDRREKTEQDIETVTRCFAEREDDPHVGKFLKQLELDNSRNEVLLFHGSPMVGGRNSKGEIMFPTEHQSPKNAIMMNGFDERLSNVKGMLGAGTYFGDHASKADCYAGRYNEWKDGVDPGSVGEEAAMFLVRVVLGCPYVTNQSLEQLRRPPCIQGHFDAQLDFSQVSYGTPWNQKGFKLEVCDHPRYDSVISDMFIDGDEKNFREYVLYEKRAYPEFLVYYTRLPPPPDEA